MLSLKDWGACHPSKAFAHCPVYHRAHGILVQHASRVWPFPDFLSPIFPKWFLLANHPSRVFVVVLAIGLRFALSLAYDVAVVSPATWPESVVWGPPLPVSAPDPVDDTENAPDEASMSEEEEDVTQAASSSSPCRPVPSNVFDSVPVPQDPIAALVPTVPVSAVEHNIHPGIDPRASHQLQ